MRFFPVVLLVVCATPALAADDLRRKPGLWEVKTVIGDGKTPARVVRQCIDATTDQMLQSIAGPFNPATCPERNVSHAAGGLAVDFKCAVAGKPATAHSVMTGSFDDAYTLTVTAESDEFAGGKMIMTMDGKWLGACSADQKPGDVVLGNGMKINVPELQKKSLSTIPMPPPQDK
ncbi:DUF3617 family protein [Bradyrhizobium jicamae]|uniref:DUF3617 family protein n=1 Tax=Bradyrhizobium jicamae TaxID=280332 RepID=A0ABS5FPS7_9BRAD|nr:DUF3617 family protein [Bradyrhizobium jicamae]MBR0798814.1 DUF3617 family protein [Bradyrhizobium jicamae]MBR0934705.1 DUF3617 family protein [Bradyrhizobium jicamae]